jgi:PAS domain S-box-containing protein
VFALSGYQILAQIYESSNSLVYRGIREQDNQAVILKFLKEDYPTPEEIRRYKQEYHITRNLNLDGVIKAYGLEKYRNTLVIIFEDFGGESLRILMNNRTLILAEFLNIAIQAANSLGQIHAANIIHKDINPSNIVYNPELGQVKIIDFGISTILTQENPTIKNPRVIEGTLAYISPEQTGRMNRSVDYRTDFYSLGVTFYEMLAGQLPYYSTDAMEVVHCHIAKPPVPLHRARGIPKAVSDIVMKLLAKTAEERYQSAYGLKADLQECLTQLQANGRISEFAIARHDISDKLQIPQKLYGRESDVETLLATFDRVALGSTELILVAGFSGIGKSALVNEVHKPIVRQRGYFISGKFDQFKRNIPLDSLVQAFSDLMRQLLTESEDRIATWKAKLLEAFGVNGQVIIDVIPEVELIIGKQPPATELSPTEALNRFNLLFQKFIRVFAQAEHPLVIVLDDLQWADSASLKLLELLITDTDTRYLLIIGAYRDNEVNSVHPLMLTLDEIRKTGASVNQIVLTPLDLTNLNCLIADTLNCSLERSYSLAELVLHKTQGNPFFTNQFLKSLYSEGLLTFEYTSASWQWDINQVRAMTVSDNVVEFMADKLQNLKKNTQQVLKLAACIGNQFDLNTLAVVHEKSPVETAIDLWESLREGLILPIGDDYKFLATDLVADRVNELLVTPEPLAFIDKSSVITSTVTSITSVKKSVAPSVANISYQFLHDRVQQAAYSLISEADKQAIHLKIGQLLLQSTTSEEREEKIFDIVNQLNFGVELIAHQTDRDELAQLNLIAGRKAKAATAYEAAVKYLTTGMTLLAGDSWQNQYDLTLALYLEAAEAEYLNANFEQSEKLIEIILQQAKNLLDLVKVYELKMQIYTAQSQLLKSIDTGLQALEMLGVSLSVPSDENLVIELPKFTDLETFPEMTEPYKKAAMRILVAITPASYIAKPELGVQVILTMVNLCLEYGHSELSVYAYCMYGLFLCGALGNIDAGYYSGQLAFRLIEQFEAYSIKSKFNFLFNSFIRHWKEPIRESIAPLNSGLQSVIYTGDLEYSGYCIMNHYIYSFFTGCQLDELEQSYEQSTILLLKIKQNYSIYSVKIWKKFTLKLIEQDSSESSLGNDSFNEAQIILYASQNKSYTLLFQAYLARQISNYLFKNYKQALNDAGLAEEYAEAALGLIFFVVHNFYYSLVLLAQYPTIQPNEQQQYLNQVAANQEKMQHWAYHAPANYQHKYDLVEAERARILGNPLKAMEDYDKAIQGARENGYIQEEALAYEKAAEFYLELGRLEIAHTYMTRAYHCYGQWGATSKAKDLEQRYPQLISRTSERNKTGIKTTTTITLHTTSGSSNSSALDLTTVLKASQALGCEIVLDKLLAKLMKIMLENAGAQKGCLILEQAGKLLIEAEGSVERDNVTVLQSIPVGAETSVPLPATIINYVARTKNSVVLNNATHESKFSHDAYITQNQPKSILCTPLLNQGKLTGILYLENNLTTGAFTSDQLEVLKFLSSQAAISIENAKLYSKVRMSESRLAQFLEAVPVGIFVMDATGKPYYSNQTAQQLLGLNVLPEVGVEQLSNAYQLYRSGTDRLYSAANLPTVKAMAGETVYVNDIDIHQPNKIVPIEAWATPIYDEKGNIIYAIAAFQDITERKKADAERLNFTQELFRLNKAFARFLPRQFLQFLNKESIVDVQLGDQVQQEMSVLFADIRDFTTLSEGMTPEHNFKFINAYLSRMEPAIIQHQGFIDKYIGDAIMALFSGGADNAVQAAIAMLNRLAEYNQHRTKKDYEPVRIGIGINTGSLILGTVGGHDRMDSTVISDAVNLTSRIEGLTKNYGVSLLISHYTLLQLEDANQYAFRLIGRFKLKGKSAEVSVFEVFDADAPAIREAKLATKKDFEQALVLYNLGNLGEATQRFQEVLRINPSDTVAQIYLERCQNVIKSSGLSVRTVSRSVQCDENKLID